MSSFIVFRKLFFKGWFLFMAGIPLMAEEPLLFPSQEVSAPGSVTTTASDSSGGHYKVFFSFGLLPGNVDVVQSSPISLGMSHGYYNKGLYTGIGMAVENFTPAFFPVFADMRFYVKGKQCHPYIRGILGKNFVIAGPSFNSREDDKVRGKIVTGVGGGISYPLGERYDLFFYLGYRYMKFTNTYDDYQGNPVKDDYKFNRLEFRLGISF